MFCQIVLHARCVGNLFRISRPTAHNRVIEVVTATIYRLLRMQDLDFLPTNPTVHFLYLLTIYPTSD